MSINLVPFIDLMAVTISFLIMTAVWTQLGRLEVSQRGAENTDAAPTEPSPEIAVLLTREQITVRSGEGTLSKLQADAKQDGRLIELLRQARGAHAEAAHVTVSADDDVTYDALVHAIDACIAAGLSDVTVSTG